MILAIIGLQYGDEGKGKIVDYLCNLLNIDYVVRFNGGPNAGHHVNTGYGECTLHQVPTGIVSGKKCVIAEGCVINLGTLVKELEPFKTRINSNNLFISKDAQLILPHHKILDLDMELRRKERTNITARLVKPKPIGSTRQGITPCYVDKINRIGLSLGDLVNNKNVCINRFKEKFYENISLTKWGDGTIISWYGLGNIPDVAETFRLLGEQVKDYVCDTSELVANAIEKKKDILFEGAQGTMLDINKGTYPYVTSSQCTINGIPSGIGLPFSKIKLDCVIGVLKAYTTRVGEGPLPGSIDEKLADKLREKGYEYGRTTQRPRRLAWFDAVMTKRAVELNNVTALALTKLDVLSETEHLDMVVGYRAKEGNKVSSPDVSLLDEYLIDYERSNGWKNEISSVREYEKLPDTCKKYIEKIEKQLGVKARLISVGAERNQTISLYPYLIS